MSIPHQSSLIGLYTNGQNRGKVSVAIIKW